VKIKIDTINKIIELEEAVNFKDLFKILNKLLPNGLWEDFTLNINATVYWTNPIVVNPYPLVDTPYTLNCPWIVYSSGTGDNEYVKQPSVINGIYCVELNNY